MLQVAFGISAFIRPASYCGRTSTIYRKSIQMNTEPFAVVEATPPGLFGVDTAEAPDIYLPVHANLVLEPGRPEIRLGNISIRIGLQQGESAAIRVGCAPGRAP